MKKAILGLALCFLCACGTVTVKEGQRECTTMTFGIFGASAGAFLSNGCPGR